MSVKPIPKPAPETVAALIGTAFSAILLVLTAMNAGPLWRDEINTLNLARMPSLRDIWHNLQFDSCPLLWPLLVRGGGMLELTDGDTGIRILGLGIGLFFLSSLWLCQRWIGGRAPTLSIALLGGLPAFIFVVGANRAYGLASCLLVLSFGKIWQLLESPTKSRILSAGFICLLFAQCVYYDVIFLGTMLAAGALIAIRRQQWKILWTFAGIGLVVSASLLIYLPIIHRVPEYLPFWRSPFFVATTLWNGLVDAVAARSSANPDDPSGPQIWIWIGLLFVGIIVAVTMQRTHVGQTPKPEDASKSTNQRRSDLALFCVTNVVVAIIAYFGFLLKLQFFVQPWYYVEIMILCAISLDGILGANWPALRPWGLVRMGFLMMMMILNAGPAWAEAHTRRSNLDLVAAFLTGNARAGDLIVIQDAWESITFNRYYRGQAQWLSVPPIDSHEVHRIDLVIAEMNEPKAMTPVLSAITNALISGHHVWLVGSIPIARWQDAPPGPTPLPPRPSEMPTRWWIGSYLSWWNQQVTTLLLDHAQQEKAEEIAAPGPVNHFEDVSVARFTGYNSGTE
ncbi:MAG TPA: hypothetical protein VFH87_11390 [Candidatus Udaeobacter sp.]|jgi:hypothetical protein|nr:hypothetical protein [Candidatus Udaeobacter sp.]